MERITVWLARFGFLSIAACTFGLSFDAIRDVAQNTGAVDPSLAWIVPLAVDGMIVTATAVLWTESLSGRGWHMFPLLAIIGPAALSMWSNVAHASGDSLLAQVLAAVPPAGLILSLELVSWQIRRERTTSPRFTPAWVDRERRAAAEETAAQPNGMKTRSDREVGRTRDRVPVEPVGTAGRADETGSADDAGGAGPRAARPAGVEHDAGQLRIGADDTGRITLDVPSDERAPEVWTQIIAAVQDTGHVPTQRQLADELNVSRSRVRRAIEHNRDAWDELRVRVEDAESSPVG